MKILVCGGRNFKDKDLVYRTLDDLVPYGDPCQYGNSLPKNVTIIHGGAEGADSLADEWALVNWCSILEYPADWKKYGKAAGPIRNTQMLIHSKPDLVLAFPGGAGTANMVKLAEAAGVEVKKVGW